MKTLEDLYKKEPRRLIMTYITLKKINPQLQYFKI